jgi:hypothetical protein
MFLDDRQTNINKQQRKRFLEEFKNIQKYSCGAHIRFPFEAGLKTKREFPKISGPGELMYRWVP